MSRGRTVVRAEYQPPENPWMQALAPAELKSPTGEMLAYYLKDQPHLFQETVETLLARLQESKEERERLTKEAEENGADKASLVLNKRMEEVRMKEVKVTVEDVMYMCVVDKFVQVGVDMLPPLNNPIVDLPQGNLRILTEGVHSKEALEFVREHLLSVMAGTENIPSQAQVRMSKLQAAQVYAASVMFGYFVRQVDKRFQLDRALGTLPEPPIEQPTNAEAVMRLERLFQEGEGAAPKEKAALRQYVESFDAPTLASTARLVSMEGAALVERQTTGLFGNVRELQEQMRAAVGDVASMQELMERVEGAIAEGKVESLTMNVGTQRRLVLEAVAYGTFLRDVETQVDGKYDLLTPVGGGEAPDIGMGGPGGAV
ncbi:unnamed protein product [Pedinophyceae sp. YPF-701]|nr:unnamed protein product [Pedinophyceae sp. YPF-701]